MTPGGYLGRLMTGGLLLLAVACPATAETAKNLPPATTTDSAGATGAAMPLLGTSAIKLPSLIGQGYEAKPLTSPVPAVPSQSIAPIAPPNPAQWLQNEISRQSTSSQSSAAGAARSTNSGAGQFTIGGPLTAPFSNLSAPFTDLANTIPTPQSVSSLTPSGPTANTNQFSAGPGSAPPPGTAFSAAAKSAAGYWNTLTTRAPAQGSMNGISEPVFSYPYEVSIGSNVREPYFGNPPLASTQISYLMPFPRIVWVSVLVSLGIAIFIFAMWVERTWRESRQARAETMAAPGGSMLR